MIICIHTYKCTSSIVYCTFRSDTECVGFIQYLRFRPHNFKRKKRQYSVALGTRLLLKCDMADVISQSNWTSYILIQFTIEILSSTNHCHRWMLRVEGSREALRFTQVMVIRSKGSLQSHNWPVCFERVRPLDSHMMPQEKRWNILSEIPEGLAMSALTDIFISFSVDM